MKVLLAPFGTRGDCQPLLHLGVRLASEGHDVLVAGPPNFLDDAEGLGLDYRAFGPDIQRFLADAIRGGGIGLVSEIKVFIELFRELCAVSVTLLSELAEGRDLLIASGVQIGGRTAAHAAGTAYRYVLFCPQLLVSPEHAPPLGSIADGGALLNRGLWGAYRAAVRRFIQPFMDDARRAAGLRPLPDPWDYLVVPGEGVMACDPEVFTGPGGWEAEPVGAFRLAPEGALDEDLEAFLGAGPPPVYLGFGSMPHPDPADSTRKVVDAVERSGVRLVLSAGWAQLGDGDLPDAVFRVGPCAHHLLFPRCAGVVHHGGAGTLATALRAGVPQGVVAHVADQHYNGWRLEAVGLAPRRLSARTVSGPALARLLASLSDPLLTERARQVGERVRARDSLANGVRAVTEVVAG